MPSDLELIIGTAIPTLVAIFGLFSCTHTYRESQVLKEKRDSISADGLSSMNQRKWKSPK